DEGAFAVDLDDRQPLAMRCLELRVAGDVDLSIIHALRVQNLSCALAEVAALRRIKDDVTDRYRASQSPRRRAARRARRRPYACRRCALPSSPRSLRTPS